MGGRCEECPAGTYAPEATTVCETCLAGSADADQWAATPCVDCPPGFYAPDLALECTDCAAVVFDGNATLGAHAYHVWNPETESIAFGFDKDGDPRTPCMPLIPEPLATPET